MHWFNTFIEEQYFPFYEFMWVGMIALWWSVIARLKRIEDKCGDLEEITTDIISSIVEEEA